MRLFFQFEFVLAEYIYNKYGNVHTRPYISIHNKSAIPPQTQHRVRHTHLFERVDVRDVLVRTPALGWSCFGIAVAVLAHQRHRRHQHHTLVRVARLLSFAWASVDHFSSLLFFVEWQSNRHIRIQILINKKNLQNLGSILFPQMGNFWSLIHV